MKFDPRIHNQIAAQPFPLLFITISGAHLYGFPSPDSDYDLRGVHLLPKRGDKPEWQHTQDYWTEKDKWPAIDLDDGTFVYG